MRESEGEKDRDTASQRVGDGRRRKGRGERDPGGRILETVTIHKITEIMGHLFHTRRTQEF